MYTEKQIRRVIREELRLSLVKYRVNRLVEVTSDDEMIAINEKSKRSEA